MKPGSRAESNFEQDVPDTIAGHAEVGSSTGDDHPAAVLWVPDPEQRHGWREFYVHKAPKPRKPVGFRR